jgi:hypothetical protein
VGKPQKIKIIAFYILMQQRAAGMRLIAGLAGQFIGEDG